MAISQAIADRSVRTNAKFPTAGVYAQGTLSVYELIEALLTSTHSDKTIIGRMAKVQEILASSSSPKVVVDALKELIRTPLFYDPQSQSVAQNYASHPGLAKYVNLSYRWMLKCMNFDTILALAATQSHPSITEMQLQSLIETGTWSQFSGEAGFNSAGIRNALAAHLPAAGMRMNGGSPVTTQEMAAWAGLPSTAAQPSATPSTQPQGVNTNMAFASINPTVKPLIDGMLQQAGVGMTIDAIAAEMSKKAMLENQLIQVEADHKAEVAQLRSSLQTQAAMPSSMTITNTINNGLPNGTMKMVPVDTIFPILSGYNLQVPSFSWDAPHPDVPEINSNYIFRKGMLLRALNALVSGDNFWLVGHTGSGKTTLVEQIASRLGWPVVRIAFDSNVDRSELVGRMNLRTDGQGGTMSEWLSGVLEHGTRNGYIILTDELDASHPNSVYTLQPLLEGKPLTLLEDGGRVIPRHPMARIVATGNTSGNGDPSGLYPACRILSAATLDRFVTFVKVPYMTLDEEVKLIKSQAPTLDAKLVKTLAKFAVEMRNAFTSGQTAVSYSPRRSVAFAKEIESLFGMGIKDEKVAVATAFCSKLYDASPEEYRQRITEIASNVFGGVDPSIAI